MYNYRVNPSFFRPPNFGKSNYFNKTKMNNLAYNKNKQNYKAQNLNTNNNIKIENKETETSNNVNFSNELNNDRYFKNSNNEVLFDFFGIQIYFDDILLICILLFLYEEGIHDDFLFIALILLLLS